MTGGTARLEGAARPPAWTDGYACFGDVDAGQAIRLRFTLKAAALTLSPRLHTAPIRVRMRGDAVAAMDSFGAALTFFDPCS